MNKAVDLAQVIRFFDPRHPLEGQELKHWFIERPETPRHELEFFLRSIHSDDKVLFIGPRGSGKTTELNKLSVALADSFTIIPIPTMDLVGRADLNYVDLMLAIATQVTTTAVDRKVLPTSVSARVRQGLEDPLRWWKIIFDEAGLRLPAEEQSIQLQLSKRRPSSPSPMPCAIRITLKRSKITLSGVMFFQILLCRIPTAFGIRRPLKPLVRRRSIV